MSFRACRPWRSCVPGVEESYGYRLVIWRTVSSDFYVLCRQPCTKMMEECRIVNVCISAQGRCKGHAKLRQYITERDFLCVTFLWYLIGVIVTGLINFHCSGNNVQLAYGLLAIDTYVWPVCKLIFFVCLIKIVNRDASQGFVHFNNNHFESGSLPCSSLLPLHAAKKCQSYFPPFHVIYLFLFIFISLYFSTRTQITFRIFNVIAICVLKLFFDSQFTY